MHYTPANYSEFSILARAVGEEMVSRLDWTKLQPEVVADVGCGTGELTALLAKRYPAAQILAVDASSAMLTFAKAAGMTGLIAAEAARLPLAEASVDLVFSNLVLPWHQEPRLLVKECRRILRPNGLFTFTSLGPQTFTEWQGIFPSDCLPQTADMHNVGDALLEDGFIDPIIDVDYFTFTYRDAETFWRELCASGMLPDSETFRQQYHAQVVDRAAQGKLAVTFEVVYGHAWTPDQAAGFKADDQGVATIPLMHLRNKLRGG